MIVMSASGTKNQMEMDFYHYNNSIALLWNIYSQDSIEMFTLFLSLDTDT